MKSIQSTLKQWAKSTGLKERLDKQREELLTDSYIKAFIKENKDSVTNEMLDTGMVKLYEFKKERRACANCPGLKECPNMMKGYQPSLSIERGHLELHYLPCALKVQEKKQKEQSQLMKSLYIPKDILSARFEEIDMDGERGEAGAAALEFALKANPGEDGGGLYFYGKFGVGKTYLMGAVANELFDRGIESYTVYTPDFFREMKQSLGDGTFQEKLDTIKKAQVLILDDIGAETTSSWVRDDVLGAILQYRMLEKLPTLFTSNYDYDELEDHLSYSDRGGIEELKAKRIMERIKHNTTFVTVAGHNRREKR
ncbi:primosomal protein DnaI [Alkalihalophilus marmarensis]|jgi:primosomal protein DnaI|uniref:Primosomal protein DnaI n=1 Tax=Alkalihalophilus marmarensis DSM 21297 TaxID=1188261 RepID=U6SLN4_9BACI|nr:primosomal protein DnaI [Alkalihalophilus marmarensis]ERN52503.1 primosomal protein DnaI [Alkalihalophilus marmarensis DSM 21297]MCM3487805.1 primosomal protein DnaI [Alkalihalophilus marmarensis]